MAPGQSSVSSSANSKKLTRPQRTEQSKSTAKPASEDVYDIALDSDSYRAMNGDDSFRSYIAREAEEILDAAGDKGSAKDAKSQKDTFATKYWRFQLQKSFLSEGKNPKKEDLQAISGYLGQLEHSPDLHSAVIRATKIRRALTEILKLKKIPGDAEFRFKGRFERLLERCDKALREKSPAGDMEQPKISADEDGRSITEAGRSTSDLGIDPIALSPLNIEDNSQNHQSRNRKRKTEDHVAESKKRIRKRTSAIIVIDSEEEDNTPQNDTSRDNTFQDRTSQNQSHLDESDTSQHGTLQHEVPRPRRTPRKSTVGKEEFRKQVDRDFKWIDNTKGLVTDARELVEELLPILKVQEEQISEQRVKVKGLAQQLICIEEFLNNCGAQEEKTTMRWQNR